MKRYIFLLFSLLVIAGCSSEAGSMPGYLSTPDEIYEEYGEHDYEPINAPENASLSQPYFNYNDETSYIAAGISEEEDIVYSFGLNFSETDEPERTYEEALEEAKKHMPEDAEEVNEEQTDDGIHLRFETDEFEEYHQFNVNLIEGDNDEMYNTVFIVPDLEIE
ncbi:membrane lipoprotein lipid attachment site-containing protein [Oceanobacillus jeddahense]|uniref:membrane lipoprotein lipid attachment site-containing protein n=1 Tax=Oceanobacillus jeddahense TaxID=1462527 RepID=UPI00059592F3|nr:membrane lipoprotein lipid attachment site-containing protein [Oceanobacillus jeddahense]